MRIVYCIASIYNSGGKDRVICQKANWLAQNGHEVYLITTDQDNRPPYFAIDSQIKCIDLNINYEKTNSLPLLKRILAKREQRQRHFTLLKDKLAEIEADIVISTFEEDGGILAKLQTHCPKIVELHYSKERRYHEYARGKYDWRRLLDWFRTRQDEYHVKKYDHLVVLTSQDYKAWSCMKKRSVIPNPLSFTPQNIAPLREKKILAIGRYSYEKNFEALIRIWADISPQYPEWKLEIVGEGFQRTFLQNLISSLNLNHCTTLTPSTKQIEEKYLSSSIYTMTSRYEGFPLVLLEAMSCGLPIVAFDCPFGPRELIVEDETGYLIPPHDNRTFGLKLKKLMESEELRHQLGNAGHTKSKNYSMDSIMREWTNLFTSLQHHE